MTSKTIFNMNTAIKKAAMKKAKNEGLTLSAVLNFAARAYVDGLLKFQTLDKDTLEALDDIKHGRLISQEELFKKLGL
jgi:hypothetical protein